MPVSADGGPPARPASPGPVPPSAWWGRDFPGAPGQVGEVRHWVGDLLPECDPLADVLLLTSELCTNAVVHTLSGKAGGRFSIDVGWTSDSARVVIGDQGSLESPAAGQTGWADESGRGLWLVDEVADDWGTACHPAGRVVWADVQWQARGGRPLDLPGGMAALAGIAAARRAFPGTATWWGHRTRTWWAALPGAASSGLISSPTWDGLGQVLADAYPRIGPAEERSEKGNGMVTAQCSCGFTELDDEDMTDHLHEVFEPDDRLGNDGQLHEERGRLTCACGLAAITAEELDFHLLKVFTPDGAIGRDGQRHEADYGA